MIGSYDYERLHNALTGNSKLVKQCLSCISKSKNRLVASSLFEVIEADSRALGGVSYGWCIPKSRRDLLVAIEPRMSSEKFYQNNNRNYCRYLDELESENVVHSFGIRDMTAYCIEPFCLSWKDCNESTVALFPASLIRMIDSMDALIGMFLTMSGGRNVTQQVLYERFVEMISRKREFLHPSIQKSVPKLTDGNRDNYADEIKASLVKLDPLEGMKYVNFDLEALPETVYSYGFPPGESEFAELIPREKRATAKPAPTAYSMSSKWNENMISSCRKPTIDLDIANDPIDLLQLLERKFHKKNGTYYGQRLFVNYADEVRAANQLWEKIEERGARTHDCILSWVSWFVSRTDKIDNSRSIILDLLNTWGIFMSEKPGLPDEYGQQENIVNHISGIFSSCDSERAVQEVFLIYGFAICYAYMKVTYGTQRAKEEMESAIYALEALHHADPVKARRKIEMMCMATSRNLFKMGPIHHDAPNITAKIRGLIEMVGIVVSAKDKDSSPTVALEMYWTFVDSRLE